MRKILLLTLCLYTLTLACEADIYYNNSPYIKRPHHNKHFGKKIIQAPPTYINNNSDISMMEQALFKRNFHGENLNQRLTRLEENMFGESINGTISERYRNLANSFDYNYPNPYRYYNSPYSPETSQKLGIINRLANFLTGTQTGVTPNLNNDYDFEDSYQTPYGYGYSRRSNGNGMSIRILD